MKKQEYWQIIFAESLTMLLKLPIQQIILKIFTDGAANMLTTEKF